MSYAGLEYVDPEELARHRKLTEALWEEMRKQGVHHGDPGRIECVLLARDDEAAARLIGRHEANGWEARLDASDEPGASLRVTVVTPEVALSRAALMELVEVMLIEAYECGCELDGFQVAIPADGRRPWWKLW